MVDFRKWFPALAIGALVIGSAATASAQITPSPSQISCVANAGATPLVRAEGLTELVGDVVLNCTGGTPTAAGQLVPQVNIQIFLNTNVTSRLLADPLTEALLLIDDPAPGQQVPCVAAAGATTCPVTGIYTGQAVGTPGSTGVNFRTGGVPNVFQGRRVFTGAGLTTANSITWLGVPIDPPGTNGIRTIRITNVRADANFIGVSAGSGLSAFLPNQITEFISTTPSQALPVNNPQQTVAFTAQGLNFTTRTTPVTFLQCISANAGATSSSNPSSIFGATGVQNGVSFLARFSEGFASSFKRRNTATQSTADTAPTPVAQNQPGGVCPACTGGLYFTETGFYEPAFTSTNGLNRAGLADTGTRLMLRFAGVPANTSILVGLYENGKDATNSRVRLVSTDASGANTSSGGGYTAVTGLSNGFANVSLTGGAGFAVYEVVGPVNPTIIEDIDVPVAVSFTASPNPPGLGTATVTGSFAPLSTVRTSDATSPIPRFFDSPVNRTIFNINPCSTNLLFPFVTNQAGFDTGLAIANTSNDPFKTPLQQGPCTINYYSTTGPGAVTVLTAETFKRNVVGGETVAWPISTGSTDLGVAAHAGFQGYIIAQCQFQFAHGFAFISTAGATATTGTAEGYLALVMDASVGNRTGFLSEPLGQ
jgi:hypothetical protein